MHSLWKACQEAIFMVQLTEEIFKRQVNVIVYSNNQGALFLVKNHQVGQQTKHIDICQHFVRNLQKQKRVLGTFVHNEDNMADGAKNLLENLLVTHAIKLKTGENLISQSEDVGANNHIQESEFSL